MHKFKTKLKGIFRMQFEDKKMEDEYYQIKSQSSVHDFSVAVLFMVSTSVFGVITTKDTKDWTTFWILMGPTIFVLALWVFGKLIKRGYQYMTLLVVFLFSISRLVVLTIRYEGFNKPSIYFVGFVAACTLMLAVSRIQNLMVKILAIILFLGIRYGIFIYCDPKVFTALNTLRFLDTDFFVIYIMFSEECRERKVFKNFFENRRELIKFKELLEESLPQSVIVVDFRTQRRLFGNRAFFESFRADETSESEVTEPLYVENQPQTKMLKIDLATLREVGTNEGDNSLQQSQQRLVSLKELLLKMHEENLIGEKTISVNASYQMEGGLQRTFEMIFKKIMWDRVEAIAIIFNDTTYQEKLIALKVANANKDQIIATVSHELRTPLHGIIGLLDIAEAKVKDEEVLSHLSLCKDNAHLLSSLVNSLLDLQQLATGKLKLNIGIVDLTKTMKDVIQLFKFQCDNKNITLEIAIQGDLSPCIATDENRFKQILINLLGNAIKFTFKGGIKIEVSQDLQESDHLLISVSDTGIGIKEENIGQLFKMYGKLSDSSCVNKNGVGLGLTISNTLVTLLNGQKSEKGIEVTSQYGVGSRFFFRILKDLKKNTKVPSSIEKKDQKKSIAIRENGGFKEDLSIEDNLIKIGEEYPEEISMNAVPISSRMRSHTYLATNGRIRESNIYSEINLIEKKKKKSRCLLVVDDNPFNILVAKSLLKDLGYEVKSASGGQEAIDIVQGCAEDGVVIQVIFLDCQMPIMDGYETARILKGMMESGRVPKVPLVAWTANTSEQDIKKCYECGMTGYLSKPTTKDNIMKVLPK